MSERPCLAALAERLSGVIWPVAEELLDEGWFEGDEDGARFVAACWPNRIASLEAELEKYERVVAAARTMAEDGLSSARLRAALRDLDAEPDPSPPHDAKGVSQSDRP